MLNQVDPERRTVGGLSWKQEGYDDGNMYEAAKAGRRLFWILN